MKIRCEKCHGYGLFGGQTIHSGNFTAIVICIKCREEVCVFSRQQKTYKPARSNNKQERKQ
jgi:hypothetical protein